MNRGRFRAANPPVYRASTVLFDSIAHLEATVRDAEAGAGEPNEIAECGCHPMPALIPALSRREGFELRRLEAGDGRGRTSEALELAIIENVQRADLNAIEEATGYLSLADEFNHSHDDIAKIVGKSRSHVANTMRLLKLSNAIKDLIHAGKLSAGHARAHQ